ncbi:MAG: type II toxin-antitoxin system RelE/ParE family toxin [Deltaproteobacteria bacterium]|nr:type II toxin-antitoxin system RelE/ParE family toxin [Deltaproteobacteria bacterium]
MIRRKLVIAEQAVEDLMDIWLYVASDSVRNADLFIDLLHEKCLALCDAPKIGRKRPELLPEIRCLPVKRYLIFYRITEKAIEVARIVSGYRDIASLF